MNLNQHKYCHIFIYLRSRFPKPTIIPFQRPRSYFHFSTMFPCGCGRSFKSESALGQHRTDKQKAPINNSLCRTSSAPEATKAVKAATKLPFPHEPKDRWMWKGARALNPFHVLSEATLEPCVAAVSSETACELICSYSWQDSKQAAVKIPGTHALHRPGSEMYSTVLQDLPLFGSMSLCL